jgi:hypothetical protein
MALVFSMEKIMFNRFLMGATALSIFAGAALAETTATPPAPPVPQIDAQNPDGPLPDDSGWGNWWHKGRHHGGRGEHRGMNDHGSMGGPRLGMMAMMNGTGFHLHLGQGIDVAIMCGATPFKDCVAAAQPLIDAAKATAATQPKTP